MFKFIIVFFISFFLVGDLLAFDCSNIESAWSERERLEQEYWKRVGDHYARKEVQDLIPLIEKNEDIYQEYIVCLFLKCNKPKRCLDNNDPAIMLLNLFYDVVKNYYNYDKLATFILKNKDSTKALWFIDSIIEKDKLLQKEWYATYTKSFASYFVSKLIISINDKSNGKALLSLVYLFNESDGEYFELIFNKMFDVLKNKPLLIKKELYSISYAKEIIRSSFCDLTSEDEQRKIREIYSKHDDEKSKIILSWLECK